VNELHINSNIIIDLSMKQTSKSPIDWERNRTFHLNA